MPKSEKAGRTDSDVGAPACKKESSKSTPERGELPHEILPVKQCTEIRSWQTAGPPGPGGSLALHAKAVPTRPSETGEPVRERAFTTTHEEPEHADANGDRAHTRGTTASPSAGD